MVGRYFYKPSMKTTWDDFIEKLNGEIKSGYEVTRVVLPDMVKEVVDDKKH